MGWKRVRLQQNLEEVKFHGRPSFEEGAVASSHMEPGRH